MAAPAKPSAAKAGRCRATPRPSPVGSRPASRAQRPRPRPSAGGHPRAARHQARAEAPRRTRGPLLQHTLKTALGEHRRREQPEQRPVPGSEGCSVEVEEAPDSRAGDGVGVEQPPPLSDLRHCSTSTTPVLPSSLCANLVQGPQTTGPRSGGPIFNRRTSPSGARRLLFTPRGHESPEGAWVTPERDSLTCGVARTMAPSPLVNNGRVPKHVADDRLCLGPGPRQAVGWRGAPTPLLRDRASPSRPPVDLRRGENAPRE